MASAALFLRKGIYWIRWRERGRIVEECTNTADRDEAIKDFRRRQKLRHEAEGRREPYRLSDLYRLICADYELNGKRGLRRVQAAWKQLARYFGAARPCSEIRTEQIAEYVTHRTERVKRGTIRYELCVLHHAFCLAAPSGKVTVPHFPRVRASPARQGFFEDEQLAAVLREILPEIAPLIRFLALTGWRVSEAKGLRWDQHVDLEAGCVRLEVTDTKERHWRVFPFAVLPPLGELIREQRTAVDAIESMIRQPVPWVFPRQNGRQIAYFRRAWVAACRRAGCPGKFVHDLRRTAIRRIDKAGVPRSISMKLTGHRTERIFNAYAIAETEDLVWGVQRLAEYMGCGIERPGSGPPPAEQRPNTPMPTAPPAPRDICPPAPLVPQPPAPPPDGPRATPSCAAPPWWSSPASHPRSLDLPAG